MRSRSTVGPVAGGEVDLGSPRQLVRHLLRHADGGEDAGHQPLGVRRPLAEEVDLAVPALAHPTASAARRMSSPSSASSSPAAGSTSLPGEHDLDAALAPGRRDDVDRRRLQLDEEEVGVDCLELVAQRLPVGQAPGDVRRRRRRTPPRGAFAARRARVAGAAEKNATRRPSIGATGRGRSTVASTRGPSWAARSRSSSQPVPGSAIVSTTRSEVRCRYSFR